MTLAELNVIIAATLHGADPDGDYFPNTALPIDTGEGATYVDDTIVLDGSAGLNFFGSSNWAKKFIWNGSDPDKPMFRISSMLHGYFQGIQLIAETPCRAAIQVVNSPASSATGFITSGLNFKDLVIRSDPETDGTFDYGIEFEGEIGRQGNYFNNDYHTVENVQMYGPLRYGYYMRGSQAHEYKFLRCYMHGLGVTRAHIYTEDIVSGLIELCGGGFTNGYDIDIGGTNVSGLRVVKYNSENTTGGFFRCRGGLINVPNVEITGCRWEGHCVESMPFIHFGRTFGRINIHQNSIFSSLTYTDHDTLETYNPLVALFEGFTAQEINNVQNAASLVYEQNYHRHAFPVDCKLYRDRVWELLRVGGNQLHDSSDSNLFRRWPGFMPLSATKPTITIQTYPRALFHVVGLTDATQVKSISAGGSVQVYTAGSTGAKTGRALSVGTPTISGYSVDWGDGSADSTCTVNPSTGLVTSGTLDPTHVYSAAGTYSITLTVTNAFGSHSWTKRNCVVAT